MSFAKSLIVNSKTERERKTCSSDFPSPRCLHNFEGKTTLRVLECAEREFCYKCSQRLAYSTDPNERKNIAQSLNPAAGPSELPLSQTARVP